MLKTVSTATKILLPLAYIVAISETIFSFLMQFHFFGFLIGVIGMCLLDYRIYKICKSEKQYKEMENKEEAFQADAEEETTGKKAAKKCGLCLEITLFVFMTIVLAERAALFARRNGPEVLFDGKFPDKCASWSEALGCTRVLLEKSSCVRPSDIPDKF